MSVTFKPAYPVELTKADWQVKKNPGKGGSEPRSVWSYAQSKIDTGMGTALTQTEAAWKLIDWNKLHQKKSRVPDQAKGLLQEAKANLADARQELEDHVKPALEKLTAAKKGADAAAKGKLLSKEANAAAAVIATKLQAQITNLNSINLADFEKVVNELQEAFDKQNELYSKNYNGIVAALKSVTADPTHAGWNKAGLRKKTGEMVGFVKSSIQVGRHEFKPLVPLWNPMIDLTIRTDDDVKGADAAADKRVIEAYVKDMTRHLNTARLAKA